jgi:hypothetical protein
LASLDYETSLHVQHFNQHPATLKILPDGFQVGSHVALEYTLGYPEHVSHLILVVVGDDDFVCPPSQARRQQAGIPQAPRAFQLLSSL